MNMHLKLIGIRKNKNIQVGNKSLKKLIMINHTIKNKLNQMTMKNRDILLIIIYNFLKEIYKNIPRRFIKNTNIINV